MRKFILIIGCFLMASGLSYADHQDIYVKDINRGLFRFFSNDVSVQFAEAMTLKTKITDVTCSIETFTSIQESESFPINMSLCEVFDSGIKVSFTTSVREVQLSCRVFEGQTNGCAEVKVSHINMALQTSGIPAQIIYNH